MEGEIISHYRVTEQLGRGGMGIVYRAEDTKLNRTVALKLLPPHALTSEADRARFYREARAAAALSHPNIAHIYEIDEADVEGESRPFIVMEYIDGQTLSDRIAQGPRPIKEAVSIASQIAEGLKAAHEKNIVHRDIKSGNVMLTKSGVVKILDFGVAKTAASTILTQMGSTLGTVAYMSPEQSRGEDVDSRSDVWSLGVLLYEMITGQLPFKGDYEQAVVYGILNEEPEPLTAVRTGVPVETERIVAKCLSKDRGDRYQHVDEIGVDLKAVDPITVRGSGTLSANATSGAKRAYGTSHALRRKVVNSTAALVVLGLAVAVGYLYGRVSADRSADLGRVAMRTSLVLNEDEPVAFIGSTPDFRGQTAFALSRDGRLFAYVAEVGPGETEILVRRMHESEAVVVDGTRGAFFPFFSPDGSELGFFTRSQLKIAAVSSGTARALTDVRNPRGAVWSGVDEIVYADNNGSRLIRISTRDGTRDVIGAVEGEEPSALPDGDHVLIVTREGLSAISLSSGDVKRLGIGDRAHRVQTPRYSSSGHVIYAQSGQLMAVRFDSDRLALKGRPVAIIELLRTEALASGGQYTFSDNGTLIYAQGADAQVGRLVTVDYDGKVEVLPFEPKIFGEMRLSPDGLQLAVCVLGTRWDVWTYDLQRMSAPRRITYEGNNYNPVWSPDGTRIFFRSDRDGHWDLYSTSASSSGDVRRITDNRSFQEPSSVTTDGAWLLYNQRENQGDIKALSLADDSTVQTLASSRYVEWGGAFSPDGGAIAYMSDEAGTYDVFVQSPSQGGKRMRISSGGGMDPIWASDGRAIYYHYVRDVYRVDVDPARDYLPGVPALLFSGEFMDVGGIGWAHDEARSRFILLRSVEEKTVSTQLTAVSNWDVELRRLAPAK